MFWLGKALGPPDEARVSVLDHGFMVGDGVFETLKVTNASPFALSRHLRRLDTSLAGMGLAPMDPDLVREAVAAVLSTAGLDGVWARLRITVSSGVGPLGSDRGSAEPTLAVTLAPATRWPATTSIATVPWVRNERSPLAGLKSTSYAENAVALAHAHSSGASEAIMSNTRNELCEGTGANVFVVIDGQVLTPPLTSGALAGITRELVLEWLTGVLPVAEAVLPMSVLATADEIFITNSTRDVHPVTRVHLGADHIRDFTAGPLSIAAGEIFAQRAGEQVDP